MAINPFRVGELQLPQPLRPPAIDFSPLQSIGEGIGQYRQKQQIGGILASATGPDGQLDLNKAAAGLASAGFAGHAQRLLDSAMRQAAQRSLEQHQRTSEETTRRGQDITAGHYSAAEREAAARTKLEQERLDLERETRKEGTIYPEPDPLGLGGPTYRRYDRGTGTMGVVPQGVVPTAPAPATIAPRSDLAPDAAPEAQPTFADRFDPENAPPTRVAGLGPTALPGPAAPQAAPGTQTAQATPPTAAPVNPALQQVEQKYGPQAAAVLKDIIEYKRAPLKGREEQWITLARQVDPNYDPLEYERLQKEATAPARQFSVADVKGLKEEGTKGKAALRFSETFKPSYAGFGPVVGPSIVSGARYLTDDAARAISKDLPEAARWWQDYENFKNDVRKGTFGATLTKNELEAFERANVSAGMNANQVERFLGAQKLLVTDALKREASGLITAGYDPKVIAESYGLDLKQLGVTAGGRRGGVSPTFGDVKVPMDAANDLIARAKSGDSTKLRQDFDFYFGKGAADRILKRPVQ